MPDDDPDLVALQRKLKSIEETNAEHRAIRAERTFQRADRCGGSDAKRLKKEAKGVAKEAYPKGKIVKVTIPSADWAIEEVIEYTDTTNDEHGTASSDHAECARRGGVEGPRGRSLASGDLPAAGSAARWNVGPAEGAHDVGQPNGGEEPGQVGSESEVVGRVGCARIRPHAAVDGADMIRTPWRRLSHTRLIG